MSIKEVKQKAGRFCATRERAPTELFKKLQSWGIEQNEAVRIVTDLSEEGYVDEQRFANAYCHDKFEFNAWGKQKIYAHIHRYKLSEQVVQNALNNIDPEKYEIKLFKLAGKKWKRLEGEESEKQQQKLVNYLTSKGFELDLIWKTLSLLQNKSVGIQNFSD